MIGRRIQYTKATFTEVEFHSKIELGKEEILTLIMAIANIKACLHTHGECGEHIRAHRVEMGIMYKYKSNNANTGKLKVRLWWGRDKTIKPHASHISIKNKTKKMDNKT